MSEPITIPFDIPQEYFWQFAFVFAALGFCAAFIVPVGACAVYRFVMRRQFPSALSGSYMVILTHLTNSGYRVEVSEGFVKGLGWPLLFRFGYNLKVLPDTDAESTTHSLLLYRLGGKVTASTASEWLTAVMSSFTDQMRMRVKVNSETPVYQPNKYHPLALPVLPTGS